MNRHHSMLEVELTSRVSSALPSTTSLPFAGVKAGSQVKRRHLMQTTSRSDDEVIRSGRFRWCGHVQRRGGNNLVHRVMNLTGVESGGTR